MQFINTRLLSCQPQQGPHLIWREQGEQKYIMQKLLLWGQLEGLLQNCTQQSDKAIHMISDSVISHCLDCEKDFIYVKI